MAQVTDLNKTPTADIAPNMSVDEAARRILWVTNQLPNFITGGGSSSLSAVYNLTPPTLSNAQTTPLQTDSLGNLRVDEQFAAVAEDNNNGVFATANKPLTVATYAFSVNATSALAASSIVKASVGTLRLFSGRVDSTATTATYYLQFYNSATLPADGTVSFLCAPTKIQHVSGTDNPINLDFTSNCIYASTGIVWGLSSTEFTKTITSAFVSATTIYK